MSRVTVTFEFNNADEAIVFLGKQIDPSAVTVLAPKAAPTQQAKAPEQPASEKRGRGRPKKKGAAGEGGTPSPAQQPAAPASEAKPEGAAVSPQTAAPAPSGEAAVPSKEDLVAAMQGVLDNKSVDAVMTILAKYGVESAGQLPEAKRAEFIAYCGKVARGEVEAGK